MSMVNEGRLSLRNNNMNRDVIQKTLDLLYENPEWEDRYAGYAKFIPLKIPKAFKKPQGLSVYSSVSDYKQNAYSLRFDGQTVAMIYNQIDSKKVLLEIKEEANKKYFGLVLSKEKEKIDWNVDPKAKLFRRFFRDKAKEDDVKIKSQEHRVENRLLKEFANKTRAENKAFTNIQPITLNGCFFQMPTPIKASTHAPGYSQKNGGGIDIMARTGGKICVMEVKDENKASESQVAAMEQALTYATFIARLLRSKSGQIWWNFFMGRDTDIRPVDRDIEIEVVTIMPAGNTEEYVGNIELPELSTIFHCHTLYYDDEQFKNGKFEFSGTFCNR